MAGSYWDRFTTQRVTRRRALQSAGLAGATAGAVIFVGCGGGNDSGTKKTPVAGSPTTGGDKTGVDRLNAKNPPVAGQRFQVSSTANFDTFDPHLGIAGSTAYFARIYNVLINQSATKPEFFFNDLATSYENPDNVTWNFKMRPGVKIGPNPLEVPERDMTGEDVVATFERIKSEPKANNGAFVKEFVESVTTTGDSVTIKTTKAFAFFLNRVGNFVNAIPPKELIANPSIIEKMRSASAGGGPYRLVSSTEGQGAKLDRNPSYYLKDVNNSNGPLPYLDGMDVKIITDRAGQRSAFLGGQLHTYAPENKAESDSLGSQFTISKDPAFTFIALTMNHEKKPFDDSRVRRAFSRAINRKEYVDIVYQGDAKINGLVHWPTGSFALSDDDLQKYQPFDLEDAKSLVSAVGGINVKMIYPANSPIEQHDKVLPIFLKQMEAAGIQIEQQPQDFTTWLENYRTLNYALSLSLNQVYETPETPLNFHIAKGPIGDRSYAIGLNDPEIEAAVLKAKETLGLEDQIKAVHDAQIKIYEKDPTFLPFVSYYAYTAYSKKVHNIPNGLGTTGLLVNDWWIEA